MIRRRWRRRDGLTRCWRLRQTRREAAEGAAAVVVATEWPEFGALDWAELRAAMQGDLVYDTRNVVDRAAVRAAGLRLELLGRRA